MNKITLSVSAWHADASRHCIIALHLGHENLRFDDLDDFLMGVFKDPTNKDWSEARKAIRAFDNSSEKLEDYKTIEKLAKRLGYDGVEWI